MFTQSNQFLHRATGIAIGFLLTGFILLGHAASVRAQQLPEHAVFQNLQHTMLVRKAFLADQELAPLNLGVKVEKRTAYLWGAVPSQHLLDRVLVVVQKLPDIASVRSKLYVELPIPEESVWTASPAGVTPTPLVSESLPANVSDSQGINHTWATPVKVDSWWIPAPHDQTTSVAKKMPPAQPDWPAQAEKNTSFKATSNELPISNPEDQGLFVLPAIAVPGRQKQTGSGVQLAIPQSLEERIKSIQDNNYRYQDLKVFIRNETVYVAGQVPQWADLHSFTSAVAQLSNVGSVVIGQVRLVKN